MTSKVQSKQDLRNKIQRFLVVSVSGNPDLIAYIQKNKDTIKKYMLKHQLFDKRQHQNLSEKDMIKTNIGRYIHAFKLSQILNESVMFKKADYIITLIGVSLNTEAFLNTIELLGNDEQVNKWRKLVYSGQVFGGYGQTQLGHGSNVQGLQTEAHYDQQKKVFRLNSPTITSAKYWPGVMGMVSTHNVLQAKTFVKGEQIGVQTFIFETRDENLKPIKGVKAGDIGPKFGFQRVDNGYLRIDNVQIPRECMLMKYIQVTPEGEVKGRENKQAIKYAYGSMLYLRVALPFTFSFWNIIYPTRQLSFLYEQMGVLSQPQYRKKIIDNLSVGQGFIMANMFPFKMFHIFSSELKAKNFQKADKVLVKTHIISATFKALVSWKALKISTEVATANQFSVFRSTWMPSSYNNVVPSVTYEGDNSVLLQQTARFILMKDKGEDLTKPNLFVRDDDIQAIIQMLKYVSAMQIRRLKKVFEKEAQNGVSFKTLWNEKHQRDIIEVSKLWGIRQLAQGFADTMKDLTELKSYFIKIGKVFVKNLLEDTPQIYTYGFRVEGVQSWKEFTDEQFWAMSHLGRLIEDVYEQHKLIQREGDWLRSKL